MSRPGFQGLTRADVMALMVHELRHAGQFYSLFRNERIKGQRLTCSNISGRIGEVDELEQALTGFVQDHPRLMLRLHLEHID
jgi:hypothetical protein